MEKPKSQNLDKPHNYTELEKKRWTVEEVNSFREQQGLLEGKILVGYPSYEFKEWIMSGVNGVYHFIESDRYIQKFVDNFLQSVAGITDKRKIIEKATKYIVDNLEWTSEIPAVEKDEAFEASDLVKNKKASCQGKSLLLAYLLSRLSFPVYAVEGYARNAEISNCPDLTNRNRLYKAGSHYSGNLFNLPLSDQPIEQDVGHIWVGTQVEGKMIYADGTTGLVSTNPEEEQFFRDNYKPLAGALFGEGPGREMQEPANYNYHDLSFDLPAVRVSVIINDNLPQPLDGIYVSTFKGMALESKFPIKGFEDIKKE